MRKKFKKAFVDLAKSIWQVTHNPNATSFPITLAQRDIEYYAT